jgi:hypothetical protein
MKISATQWIIGAAVLLIGGCYWLWLSLTVQVWEAAPYESAAAINNPMLAATRFLEQSGYKVAAKATLSSAVADGLQTSMMVVSSRQTLMTKKQGQELLRWVSKGGVLVIQPMLKPNDANLSDPLLDATRTYLLPTAAPISSKLPRGAPKHEEPSVVSITLSYKTFARDHGIYPLHITTGVINDQYQNIFKLRREVDKNDYAASVLEWGDDDHSQLQVLAYGRGHIVLTSFNRFDNYSLLAQDHAELLLTLAKLSPSKLPIWFVRYVDTESWYAYVWQHAALGVCTLILTLLFTLWTVAVRFGPTLPSPSTDRRALMEHIDASARWLWLRHVGQQILLSAVRQSTLAFMSRRDARIKRLGPAELANRISARTNCPIREVEFAFNDAPAKRPADFVRQIQTLQHLRKHYER